MKNLICKKILNNREQENAKVFVSVLIYLNEIN